MKKVAVVTDSNAGIRQKEAKELGIFVLPMPFTIDDQTYYEDINLTHEEFFEKQLNGAEIFTSQPVVGNVKELWDQILKDYDEIVHIPMSSGLSGSCQTAMMLAQEYDNRVFVVDSQRISVTQKYDVIDAKRLNGNLVIFFNFLENELFPAPGLPITIIFSIFFSFIYYLYLTL